MNVYGHEYSRVDYVDICCGGGIGMNYVATCNMNQGRYTKLVYIVYQPHVNMFYDYRGKRLSNVFELITPNDLYLYRHDPGNSIFPHRSKPDTLCEIIDTFCDYPVESDWLGDYAIQNK